jgi:integrase
LHEEQFIFSLTLLFIEEKTVICQNNLILFITVATKKDPEMKTESHERTIMTQMTQTLSKINPDTLALQENLIGAQNDIEAIMSWLEEFIDSPHTYRTYQKESLRFILWTYYQASTLQSLKKQEIHRYREFLTHLEPQTLWCEKMDIYLGQKKQWQPFKGPLSESSIKTSMTILSGLFNYLHHAQYVKANPFKLIKRKTILYQQSKEQQEFSVQERILTLSEFVLLLDTIKIMKEREIQNKIWCHRAHFLLLFLAFTGLRVSELEKARWEDFQFIQGQCWLKVLGKGQKLARIPINSECNTLINNYKNELQISEEKEGPILSQLTKSGLIQFEKSLSARSMNFIFKNIAKHINLVTDNKPVIKKLQKISPHWLRHFSASEQAKANIPIHFIKAHHRHSKEDTTRLYIHHQSDCAHREAEKLNLLTKIKKEFSPKSKSEFDDLNK